MKKYLLSAILFLSFAGGVHANTVTRHYSISSACFVPMWDTQTYRRCDFQLYATNFVNDNWFGQCVHLPDSVKVTEFTAYVLDNQDPLDIQCDLHRAPLNDMAHQIMAIVNSSGDSSTVQTLTDTTIDYDIIDNSTYRYTVHVSLPSGDINHKFLSMRLKYETTTSGKEESKAVVPQRFSISQNRPNPSSGVTHIAYQLPKKSKVSLKVYDSSGRIVRTLVDGEQDAGHYTSTWYGKDNIAQMVPNGNYFYRLNIDGKAVTKKAILLK